MLVSVSHTPSQDQQTTADEGTFHYDTCTALSSVIEFVAPAPAGTHAALSPAIEYVNPTPAVAQKCDKSIRTLTSGREEKRSDEYDVMGTFFFLV